MLEFRNITAGYGHSVILNDISAIFPDRQISVLAGPNGSGKTTLLQTLTGACSVMKGGIFLNGEDLLKLPARERAKKLSFLPQIRTVIPALPVRTFVEHGRFPYLGFYRRKTAEDESLIRQAMEFTNTLPFADLPMNTLSGGIRQRVFLAMILAQNCDYIILDEPTTYLDLEGQREFFAMIRALRAQNKTVIMVLHDLSQAMRIADHLVVMEERKICFLGTPKESLKKHVPEEVFHVDWKRFSDTDGEYYFFE